MTDLTTSSSASQPAYAKDVNGGPTEPVETEPVEPNAVSGEFGSTGPFIVLYMIDPFSYGQDSSSSSGLTKNSRLAMIGLLRCYHCMLNAIPAEFRSLIQLQIVPQQVLLDFREPLCSAQFLKSLSFSVYSHCTRVLTQSFTARTLTGFGPGAAHESLLKERFGGTRTLLYTPPYILAPARDLALVPIDTESAGANERSGVIFLAYCLSEDQRWLLASCIDACGEILETISINIEVPNRHLRRKPAVRRVALQKLWEFILTVMSRTTLPWRVVVGRFGRLGHGELKGWSAILSRKNLARSSRQLRDMCAMCGMLPSGQVPCVLSACLISTELHPSIHIMIDSIKREENQSGKLTMSTPRDASCTHILVFPTSATAQANQVNNMQDHDEQELEFEMETETGDIMDDSFFGDLMPVFNIASPGAGSPKNHSPPASPNQISNEGGGAGHGGHAGGSGSAGVQRGTRSLSMIGEQEENTQQHLLQQPLAMGFYVSTATPGPLPKWFSSSCLHREKSCPVCFKAALHIHCPLVLQNQNQDDLLHQSINMKHSHPLDSSLTCDVLRYVLETYNQLSWLTVDPITNDRRSCLPAHILVLMQLYHGFDAYV